MSLLRMTLLAAASVTLLALGGLYKFQRNIIYPSTLNKAREFVDIPDIPHDEVYLNTPDGERLHSYLFLHSDAEKRKTVLILSPNAGNIGHFLPVVNYIHSSLGHNVFIYQYRGYGYSSGKATEAGLKIDADTAMEYILNHKQLKQTPIILYGRSLGGGCALYIAAKFGEQVEEQSKMAVIVENTFFDLPHVVPYLFPILGYLGQDVLSLLVTEKWPSYLEVAKIKPEIPVLFLSGTKDEVVPPSHMKSLFDLKRGQKVWREFPSHHNDTIVMNGYWETWDQFVNNYI